MDVPGTTTLWTPLPDGRRAAGPCPRSAPTWYPADPILFFLERRLRQEDVGLVTWCRRHCVCSRTVQRARARGYVHWTRPTPSPAVSAPIRWRYGVIGTEPGHRSSHKDAYLQPARIRLMFSSVTPHPWRGRYARIPGHSTAFHVRLIDGDWWPIVRWTTDDETAHCPMVGGDEPLALARAVNAGKLQLGGESGGSFHINEYGQVLVPGHRGDGTMRLSVNGRGLSSFGTTSRAKEHSISPTMKSLLPETLGSCRTWGFPTTSPREANSISGMGKKKLSPPAQDHELSTPSACSVHTALFASS